MAKVSIDTEVLSRDLVPLAKKGLNQICDVRNNAAYTDFPYDDYNWGNIYERIDSCVDDTVKYVNWINGICYKFNNSVANCVADINKIVVDDVVISNLSVK